MKKKADISIQTVVIAVLALLVLLVVVFIFWKNVGGVNDKFTLFRNSANESSCQALFNPDRKCASTNPDSKEWKEMTGAFSDCKEHCFERMSS